MSVRSNLSDFSDFPSVGDLIAVYYDHPRFGEPRYILVTEVGECLVTSPTVHISGVTEDGQMIKRFYLMAEQLGEAWEIVQRNTASVNETTDVVE